MYVSYSRQRWVVGRGICSDPNVLAVLAVGASLGVVLTSELRIANEDMTPTVGIEFLVYKWAKNQNWQTGQ